MLLGESVQPSAQAYDPVGHPAHREARQRHPNQAGTARADWARGVVGTQ